MKEHWSFLKENDTSFGLFYPLHYTIAAFDNMEEAKAARERFVADGFDEDDVAAVTGPFLVHRLETREGADWFDKLRAGIVRVIGTEAGFLDDDLKLARRGGAFLFAYTPSEEVAERARALIKRVHPIFARRYHRAGIESIRYPPQSTL